MSVLIYGNAVIANQANTPIVENGQDCHGAGVLDGVLGVDLPSRPSSAWRTTRNRRVRSSSWGSSLIADRCEIVDSLRSDG